MALIAIGVIAFYWGQRSIQPEVAVELSRQIYNEGEEITVTVRNNSFKQICFSSCYPYYLQKKDGGWQSYDYSQCPEEDLNIPCLDSNEEKTFQFNLQQKIQQGPHRVAIPINKDGTQGESFEEDFKAYSEPFEIK